MSGFAVMLHEFNGDFCNYIYVFGSCVKLTHEGILSHQQHHRLFLDTHLSPSLFNISFLVKPCNPCFYPMRKRSCQQPAHPHLPPYLLPRFSLSSNSVHRALIKERSCASIQPNEESRSRQSSDPPQLWFSLFFIFLILSSRISTKEIQIRGRNSRTCCWPRQVSCSLAATSSPRSLERTWHREYAPRSADSRAPWNYALDKET